MKKQRHLRKRKQQDVESNEPSRGDSVASCVEGIRALQKRRAQKLTEDTKTTTTKPHESEVDGEQEVLDSYVKGASRRATSEIEEMDRYIAHHMKQRLGRATEPESQPLTPQEQREKELFEVPDNLKSNGAQEVSIPGLMTGISEVRLPMACQLKNLEETEQAKAAILETGSLDRLKRKKRRTQEQEEEEATGIKRSMFVSAFGRARKGQHGRDRTRY